MICPNCKSMIDDNEESCPVCGHWFGYKDEGFGFLTAR